jgi:ATP-dependent RNA helicase DDX19/DBP5
MKNQGYKVSIIFGDMGKEERDEYMDKFRKREINFVLTTNLLARGIDIPEIEVVINFDVPRVNVNGVIKPDPENYLHRIGRAGRFGNNGIAITLYDNE